MKTLLDACILKNTIRRLNIVGSNHSCLLWIKAHWWVTEKNFRGKNTQSLNLKFGLICGTWKASFSPHIMHQNAFSVNVLLRWHTDHDTQEKSVHYVVHFDMIQYGSVTDITYDKACWTPFSLKHLNICVRCICMKRSKLNFKKVLGRFI